MAIRINWKVFDVGHNQGINLGIIKDDQYIVEMYYYRGDPQYKLPYMIEPIDYLKDSQ